MRNYLHNIWNRSLSPAWLQIYKFCLAGLFGLMADMTITLVLRQLTSFDLRFCSLMGFALASYLNFLINRNWVFKIRSTTFFKDYLSFLGVAFFSLSLRMIVMSFLMESRLNLPDFTINFLGITLPAIVSFFSFKYFVFKKSS